MRDIEIFKLMGSIFVDSAEAEKSISKTDGLAKKLGDGLGKGIKTAAKWGTAIGSAAIAGGVALFGMATKSAEATDRIDKLSQKIGISKQGFQEYEYILSQNGTSIEVLQRGFKTLNDRMQESVDGTGKGKEAFDVLGLSAKDLNGNLKSQEQMFEESAKALMTMPEGAEKSALAFDLFGKAGQELMPLLNGTAEDMDALRQQAHDLGIVLDDETIIAGAAFTDSMDNVKRSLGSVVTKVGAEVMPIIQKGLDWVMDHMPEIQQVIGVVFENIGKFVTIAVDIFSSYLLPIFQTIFDWTKSNWPTISAVIKGVFDAIKAVWDNVLKPVLAILQETFSILVDWVKENWPSVQETFKAVFDAIKGFWENEFKPVLDILWELLGKIVTWVGSQWPLISDVFKTVVDTIKRVWDGILKPILGMLWDTFKGIVKWVNDNWPIISGVFDVVFKAIKLVWDGVLKPVLDLLLKAYENIVGFVKDMFPGMQSTVKTVFDGIGRSVEAVTGFFSGMIDKVKSAWDWLTKWNKTEAKDKTVKTNKVDGSHAGGLSYVPFDGYVAELHKGERVLTAQENRERSNSSKGSSFSPIIHVNIGSVKDESDIKKISRGLEKTITQLNRTLGVG